MLLTEYDEKKHMKDTYKEGFEDGEQAGYSRGEYGLLEKQIRKKLQKGKDAATIAEELEEDLALVQKIMEQIQRT